VCVCSWLAPRCSRGSSRETHGALELERLQPQWDCDP